MLPPAAPSPAEDDDVVDNRATTTAETELDSKTEMEVNLDRPVHNPIFRALRRFPDVFGTEPGAADSPVQPPARVLGASLSLRPRALWRCLVSPPILFRMVQGILLAHDSRPVSPAFLCGLCGP